MINHNLDVVAGINIFYASKKQLIYRQWIEELFVNESS